MKYIAAIVLNSHLDQLRIRMKVFIFPSPIPFPMLVWNQALVPWSFLYVDQFLTCIIFLLSEVLLLTEQSRSTGNKFPQFFVCLRKLLFLLHFRRITSQCTCYGKLWFSVFACLSLQFGGQQFTLWPHFS